MRRVLLGLLLLPSISSATVQYVLRPNPTAGLLHVEIKLGNPASTETFRIPGWSPGYYVMAHYEKKIFGFSATDASGNAIAFAHPDARSWTVDDPLKAPVTISYDVVGDDPGLGFFGASVKKTAAYVNGPSTFMYIAGRTTEDTSLHVDEPPDWKTVTAMRQASDGLYLAGDYDEMVDNPIQMGKYDERTFQIGKIPFKVEFVAPPDESVRMEEASQTEVIRRVCVPAIKLFGSAPFSQYVFLFHLSPGGFQGGLEHRASTVLAIPNSAGMDIADLVAHEFFHAWNVKQIRPKALGPFDYTQPARTGNLWFAEGVTDYYAKLLTYRSGVQSLSWLLSELSDQLGTLEQGKTRLSKTVEDASRAVWENGGFALGDLDYYNKGLLAGLILDAAIRSRTGGKKSLDDVMRLMFSRYRIPNPGYDEDGILRACEEVSGHDLAGLYHTMIRSTAEMPFEELEGIGLKAELIGQDTLSLSGGWPFLISGGLNHTGRSVGLRTGDAFLCFQPSATAKSAKIIVLRNAKQVVLTFPLRLQKSRMYGIEPNPKPSIAAAKRFSEWSSLAGQ